MITEREQQATLLSATKKDFYQIWNELLETAGKLSERWDPTSTNESDPGIVLLKVLTAVADKLNYNIDKNTLEAFMPSAAQEESMRKLCEMMGYAMQYYRSATTPVTIYYADDASTWMSEELKDADGYLELPRFTQITNLDKDIVFTTTESVKFTKNETIKSVPCIEGVLHYCEEDNDGIINYNHLDDNFRYYLPETQVAENGIFVYNITDGRWSEPWQQIKQGSLNSRPLKQKIFKFGYDSKLFLPYIQFPDDISSLISDGLRIAYISTSGLSGNISAKTLTSFITPAEWTLNGDIINAYNTTGVEHKADEFKCSNPSAATNGADKESLASAYKNFKRTVGTFDTLVTCRDYMNKIYDLTVSDIDTTPLVSNIVVSDIRDDLNKAVTICSFDDFGISYKDTSLVTPKFDLEAENIESLDAAKNYNKVAKITTGGKITFYKSVKTAPNTYHWYEILPDTIPQLDNFDLVLYPFKTLYNLNTKNEYDATFKYDESTFDAIKEDLRLYKTISHKLKLPSQTDIVCIKNYLKLNAKITTTQRVNSAEWAAILEHIKQSIYKQFNLRQLEFGVEIPFDDILNAIQLADINIKNVSLDDPEIYTAALLKDGREYLFLGDDLTENEKNILIQKKLTPEERSSGSGQSTILSQKIADTRQFYNKLILRNVIGGRVELFNYKKDFAASITEDVVWGDTYPNPLLYPSNSADYIKELQPRLTLNLSEENKTEEEKIAGYELTKNQVVQFRAPNYRTTMTYPAYVNYYLKLNNSVQTLAIPATFQSLATYLLHNTTIIDGQTVGNMRFIQFINSVNHSGISSYAKRLTSADFTQNVNMYGAAFKKVAGYMRKTDTGVADAVYDKLTGWWYIVAGATRYDGTGATNTSGQFIQANTALNVESGKIGSTNKIPLVPITTSTIVGFESRYVLYTNTTNASPDACRYTIVDTWEEGCYVYPLQSSNYGVWYNWIKARQEFTTKLSGLYRNLGTDQSRVVGLMVDENKNKYQLCTTWYSTSMSPLEFYFVQNCSNQDVASTQTDELITWGKTADGFGRNAIYSSLLANSEYMLQSGEFLCINYTNAESSVGEMTETTTAASLVTTSEVINTYYGPGTIIRVNFAAKDSSKKHEDGASYSKTTGYDFTANLGNNYKNLVPGLYSLGANEQIEIREKVSVFVYDEANTKTSGNAPVYVYFNLLDENPTANTVFLNSAVNTDGKLSDIPFRTLNEGEYFWYTDKNKQTLTYCGAGCTIYNNTTQQIAKSANSTKVTTEQILEKGLSIVPWIAMNGLFIDNPKAPSTENDRFIRWDEYQYITLVEGDKLKSVKNGNTELTNINNEWTTCTTATYVTQDIEQTLPLLKTKAGDAQENWAVRTKLLLNMGPEKSQQLLNTNVATEQVLVLDQGGADVDYTLQNVSIKSNYVVNSSLDKVNTTINLYDDQGLLNSTITDFQLKAFKEQEILEGKMLDNPQPVAMYNTDGGYTKLSFNKAINEGNSIPNINLPYSTFYCALPNRLTNYGLLMIYYKPAIATADDNTYPSIRLITARSGGAYNNDADSLYYPVIFNYTNDSTEKYEQTWWESLVDGTAGTKPLTRFKLRPGINIIKIDEANAFGSRISTSNTNYTSFGCAINIYAAADGGISKQNPQDELIISPLDIITMSDTAGSDNCDQGINLNLLGYFANDGSTALKKRAEQLLADIKMLDPEYQFYYNAILDNSLKLDINTEAGENINSPAIWYEPNNVNNKFVISEIDSDYLDTGITLARSSRK